MCSQITRDREMRGAYEINVWIQSVRTRKVHAANCKMFKFTSFNETCGAFVFLKNYMAFSKFAPTRANILKKTMGFQYNSLQIYRFRPHILLFLYYK